MADGTKGGGNAVADPEKHDGPVDAPIKLSDDQPDPDALGNEETPQADAVARAAKGTAEVKLMDQSEREDALDWFLGDDPEEQPAIRKLELDVSLEPTKERLIEWVIQAIPRERIQQIRDEARNKGRKGRRRAPVTAAEEDANAALANLKIAAEGTLYPNLKDATVRGKFLDPADAMKYRFRNKSGLIDQIAGHVIEVSGFSEDDVREVDAVKT